MLVFASFFLLHLRVKIVTVYYRGQSRQIVKHRGSKLYLSHIRIELVLLIFIHAIHMNTELDNYTQN